LADGRRQREGKWLRNMFEMSGFLVNHNELGCYFKMLVRMVLYYKYVQG